MKNAVRALLILALTLAAVAASAEDPRFSRNKNLGKGNRPPLVTQPTGTGLAPTTWGFASHYSGSLYGTGYYAFKVDATFSGVNSMYGYTYSYPSAGFVNDIKAIYAFDVAGLDGQPSPVWSAFMFDTRERPPAGNDGISSFANIQLESGGGTHRLIGSLLFIGNGGTNLDIFDAEDFENATPFDNPELAFSGVNNSLIGTFPIVTDLIFPLDFDVTDAVNADLGITGGPTGPPVVEVPTLGEWGLLALSGLLAVAGALLLRR
jgi:hypothetical protein